LIKKFPSVWKKLSENRAGGIFLTHTVDYDLKLYILGQLPEQNVLHLQFTIFC